MLPENQTINSTESRQTATQAETDATFQQDVLAGLAASTKYLHCKYFYDERGSQLFDQICETDEYYPTRTETLIVQDNADAIGRRLGAENVLVEYGSGSSTKTRLILDHLEDQRAYLPVDISEEHLLRTAEQLRNDYPDLDIHPIIADFTAPFDLPEEYRDAEITVYFPGSTIGNFERPEAVSLLKNIARLCDSHGGLLIGFDLDKDPSVLVAAYDDAQGITSEFNLNLLHRINRELDGTFDVDQFKHVAIYNREQTRMEIYIESIVEQTVQVGDQDFHFEAGERIFTEYSHKYSIAQFATLAEEAGLTMDEVWTDDKEYFAVMHLSAE